MLQVETEFNPYFETLGLLDYSYNLKSLRKEILEVLETLGVASEKVYEEYFTEWERMLHSFDKKKQKTAEYDFFFSSQVDENFFSFFLLVLVGGFQKKLNTATKEELQEIIKSCALAAAHQEEFAEQEFKNFYDLLSQLEVSDADRWRVFAFYQEPQKYVTRLITLLEANLPIYQELYQQENLAPMLETYRERLANEKYDGVANQLEGMAIVHPTYSYPLIQLFINEHFFYSLINIELFSMDDYSQKLDEKVLIRLKAISDSSKLQILLSLKKKPKYNLELAEEMQLSAGTVSHHMGVLLTADLVYVEKNGSKVYYHLNEPQMEALLAKLKTMFLD